MDKIKILNLYTDGSLLSLRYGGYCYLITDGNNNKLHVSTNSILDKSIAYLELHAILEGIKYIDTEIDNKDKDVSVSVFSDSSYCVKSIITYVDNWSKNDWKKATGEKPKHIEEWKEIFKLKKKLNLGAFHVTSHTNIKNTIYDRNREVDKLAYNIAQKLREKEDIFK